MSSSQLTTDKRAAGKALRAFVPHSSHARSGNSKIIAGYLGKSDTFNLAVTNFAITYADQNESDYQALVAAVKSGRIQVTEEK